MRNPAGWTIGICAMILLVCGSGSSSWAQPSLTAGLIGRVSDEKGAPLPGTLMTLTGPAGGPPTTVMTDTEGRFSFAAVPPGAGYSLTASIPGYATVIAGPIALEAGRSTRIDLVLRPAADLEETVRVDAKGEMVDVGSTVTATTLNEELIEGIPLVGRRFTDLLTLAPGVTDTDGDGNPNVRGARDTGLQVRLDGTNITNPLTGHLGQQINLETVEEMEVITAGATAEYGRADGGFVNVITKSGGNDFTGSVKLFHRSKFLDGDGAGANGSAPDFNQSNIYVTAGGPAVRDHLWYFASIERLDEETPVVFTDGRSALQTREGWRGFGKVTWQAAPDHKLVLQINHDPLETAGNNVGQNISPATDFLLRTAGTTPQIGWTATLSPSLLLQAVISHQNGMLQIEPVSPDFRVIETETIVESNGQVFVRLPCVERNCRDDQYLRRTFREDVLGLSGSGRLREDGPYSFGTDQDAERTTFKTDLSYTVERGLGQHSIKSGFEYSDERYEERSITNPLVTDRTCLTALCGSSVAPPGDRQGSIFIEFFEPVRAELGAKGFNAGVYLQDSWKPRPHLAVNTGLRYDFEEIDSFGFTDFDPLVEFRETLRRYDLWCDAADAVGANCSGQRTPGRLDGPIPSVLTPPPGHPALEFDLNQDGVLESAGPEGALVRAPLTRPTDRVPANFTITNRNLAPRFSLSWDPWADGKTKVFGTWARYYDRLFLSTVATDQQPDSFTAEWLVDRVHGQADPGDLSLEVADALSIPQTHRSLTTPYTDEWTVGLERELAVEWSVSLTHVVRHGRDLLQDFDVNHITCEGFDAALGIRAMDVCGDAGRLEVDRFGRLEGTGRFRVAVPNGAPDLYVLNPHFNRILRVGNFNASRYTSTDLVLRKRLHRNWQMQLGYTLSEATGEAESFTTTLGNDPAVSDKVFGYLDFDQRHVLKWQTVVHLPRDLLIGATMQWASGLPYTIVSNVEDLDDAGNLTAQRLFPVTGRKNDQRNRPQITLNGRVEKRLSAGRVGISAFLEAENLLNESEVQFRQVDRDSTGVIDGTRRFGRRWQLGAAIHF